MVQRAFIVIVIAAAGLAIFHLSHSNEFSSNFPSRQPCSAASSLKCEDIFASAFDFLKSAPTWRYRGKDSGDPVPGQSKGQYDERETRLQRFSPSRRFYQYIYSAFKEGSLIRTSVTGIESFPPSENAQPVSKMVADEARGRLNEEKDAAVDFVIHHYENRRENWPASFLNKLRRLAADWLDYSTYITVRKIKPSTSKEDKTNSFGLGMVQSGGNKSQILGTLRLLAARDGIIPMEEHLGIRYPSINKIEPGNLAIERSVNQEVFGEILLHLLEGLISAGYKNQNAVFLTYADKYSFIMYRRLGFEPIPLSELTIQDPGMIVGNQLQKEGVLWTPMRANYEQLKRIMDIYIEKRIGGDHPEKIEVLKLRLAAIQDPKPKRERVFFGVSPRTKKKYLVRIHELLSALEQPPGIRFTIKEENALDTPHNMFRVQGEAPLPDNYENPRPWGPIRYHKGLLECTDQFMQDNINYRIIHRVKLSENLQEVYSLETETWADGKLKESDTIYF